MSPVGRVDEWSCLAAKVAPVLAAGLVALLWREHARLPVPGAPAGAPGDGKPPAQAAAPTGGDWSAFFNPAGTAPAATAGSLASRFRLAGTFLTYGTGGGDSRRAVLDDLKQRAQSIAGEGESIGDVQVVRVFRDHVLLRSPSEEAELWMAFAGGRPAGAAADATGGAADAAGAAGGDWLGGRRVGEGRWIFSRAKLVDYYAQLRDQPERLVSVFDSLKPLYDEKREITGYLLGVEGEREFFDAVGMREGDVVRAVNAMKMTNRRRAEYFIREFVADRANVFVLEIERDGEPQKLIYEVR